MTRKNRIQADSNQLSFFDAIDKAAISPVNAISLLTNQVYCLHQLEPWMAKIIPQGEYYVLCAGHPLVLCETKEKVEPEMMYRHYKINGKIYAATAVGRDKDCDFEKNQ